MVSWSRSSWSCETGHVGNIYTMGIGKHDESEPVVKKAQNKTRTKIIQDSLCLILHEGMEQLALSVRRALWLLQGGRGVGRDGPGAWVTSWPGLGVGEDARPGGGAED